MATGREFEEMMYAMTGLPADAVQYATPGKAPAVHLDFTEPDSEVGDTVIFRESLDWGDEWEFGHVAVTAPGPDNDMIVLWDDGTTTVEIVATTHTVAPAFRILRDEATV
jgi:hypothetical protein